MEEISLDNQEKKLIKKYSGNKIKLSSTNKLTVTHKEILPSNKKGNDKVIIYMSNLNCAKGITAVNNWFLTKFHIVIYNFH